MKNEFALLLRDLIQISDVKNQNIADAVGYDLSYISKWLSGKALPSEKSIENISAGIAGYICEDDMRSGMLLRKYGMTDPAALRRRIEEELLLAFRRSRQCSSAGKEKTAQYSGDMPLREAVQSIEVLSGNSSDAALLVDLLSLNHEDRLQFLGIRNGNFLRTQYQPEVFLSLIIDLDSLRDVIYDTLSVIHLISGYSLYNMTLYNSRLASQKFCVSVLSEISLTGFIFPDDRNLSFSVISENSGDIDASYKKIKNICRQEDMMFRKQRMEDFVLQKEYLKSMLSANIRWIIGHVTELVLPDELFRQLMDNAGMESREELLLIHDLSGRILRQPETRVMLYETAISDMLADGTVDFFNRRVTLTARQKKQCVEYWIELNRSDVNVRLIEGGFSTDFRHVYSPCIFISDTSSYLRLEDAYGREDIMTCIQPQTIKLLSDFFEAAWTERGDIVLHDKTEIEKKLAHYLKLAQMLS